MLGPGQRDGTTSYTQDRFDAQGNFLGTQKVWQHIGFQETPKAWTRVAITEVFDPAGNFVRCVNTITYVCVDERTEPASQHAAPRVT